MKRLFCLLLFLSIINFFSGTLAQPSGTLYFTTAFPVGEFKDYSPSTGFGAATEFFFFTPSERVPYGLGINLSYISYGVSLLLDPYNQDVLFSFNRANNFASAHILFQIAPYEGSVRPYIETLFGGSYIYSSTEIINDYGGAAFLWIDDWAWSYGAGLGLKLFIHGNPFFNSGSVFMDIKVRYLFGTSAEYLNRNSVSYDGYTVYYSTSESKTDMLTASIGLYFFF